MFRLPFLIFFLIVQASFARNDCAIPPYDSISIEDFRRLASEPCSLPLSQLIGSLPERMRDSPVFVKDSKSLVPRCFDPKNPRVIYSAPNLVVAVPWRATFDKSCEIVEAIGRGKKPGLNPTLLVYRERGATLYNDGKGCARCHGPDFKPKWENYPERKGQNWTGRLTDPIGTRDDNVVIGGSDFNLLNEIAWTAQARSWFGPRLRNLVREREALLRMKENFDGDIIDLYQTYKSIEYLHLPFVFTFMEDHSEFLAYDNYKSKDYGARPNLKLGIILGEMNAERIADRVFATLPRNKILAALSKENVCENDYQAEEIMAWLREFLNSAGVSSNDLVLGTDFRKQYYNGSRRNQQDVIRALLKRLGLTGGPFECGDFVRQ